MTYHDWTIVYLAIYDRRYPLMSREGCPENESLRTWQMQAHIEKERALAAGRW